jgi:hypothetical protein
MQRLPLKSVSFLLAAVIVYALQVSPITGVFLMMLGGPALTGILIDAFFITLFFEAWRGRVPSWLMGVPVIAIGLYYGNYFQDVWDGHNKNAALLAENPKVALQFDPNIHSLADVQPLVEKYAIPIMYQPWGEKGQYRALRLLPSDHCNIRPNGDAGIFIINYPKTPNGKTRLCVLATRESPSKSLVAVERVSKDPHRLLPESEEIAELRVDGVLKAQFKILRTSRLSPIPLFAAGCSLDSGAPAWRCFAQFMRVPVTLDGYGAYWTDADEDRPEAVMLGLRRYTDEELNNYQGHPESEPFAR